MHRWMHEGLKKTHNNMQGPLFQTQYTASHPQRISAPHSGDNVKDWKKCLRVEDLRRSIYLDCQMKG